MIPLLIKVSGVLVVLGLAMPGVLASIAAQELPGARVEGLWSVEYRVEAVREVGDPDSANGWVQQAPDLIQSHWTFTPICDSGPCDIALHPWVDPTLISSALPCILEFDGVTASGQFARFVPVNGCELLKNSITPNGTPNMAQPISFIVTDSVESPDGQLASAIEGTWTHIGTFRYAGEPASSLEGQFEPGQFVDWIGYELIDSSFVATRVDLPLAVESTTTTTVPVVVTTVAPEVVVTEEGPAEAAVDPVVGGGVGVSVLAASVREPGEVSVSLPVVGTNLVLALLLVLLMPFPGELFNQTFDENHERISGWFQRFVPRRFADRLGESPEKSGSGVGMLVLVTAVGGLMAGLLDPSFGWSLQSLAVFLGGLAAVGVVILVTVGVSGLYLRRSVPSVGLSAQALPAALVVAVACVVLSRLIGFQPGYLYGVLAGLAVAGVMSKVMEGRAAALAAGSLGVVALVAWLVWTGLQSWLGDAPGFGAVWLDTFLAGVFVAGLEGMAFGLVPMRFLAGAQVFKWSRWVWGALFGVGLFAFLQLLAHPGRGYGPTDSAVPFVTALALFVGFGVVSVGFWAWFRYKAPPQPS